jgi:polar amino acid transport system substrate-binding protein
MPFFLTRTPTQPYQTPSACRPHGRFSLWLQVKGNLIHPAMNLRLIRAVFCIFALTAWHGADSSAQDASGFPRFRHVAAEETPSSAPPLGTVRLLAEPDYAPWSFSLDDGTMAGISVDLALMACEEAEIACEVLPTPFTGLLSSLTEKTGDGVISGLRVTPEIEANLAMTRPYFRSFGQFAAREGLPLEGADPVSLAGKRVGFVEGTLHGAFLTQHYAKSELVPKPAETALFEDLRTGALDVAFADAFRLMFWMNGEASRNCCRRLGRPMIDSASISRPLVYLFRPESAALRDRFDQALDRLETSGRTAAVFQRYLPGQIW